MSVTSSAPPARNFTLTMPLGSDAVADSVKGGALPAVVSVACGGELSATMVMLVWPTLPALSTGLAVIGSTPS